MKQIMRRIATPFVYVWATLSKTIYYFGKFLIWIAGHMVGISYFRINDFFE